MAAMPHRLRSVKGWLRQVDLAIKHLQPEDPVLYALLFLKDHAATWRKISLAQKFPGLENIPWDSLVTELMNYYVPASVQNQA